MTVIRPRSVALQPLERVREHPLADAADPPPQLAEAQRARLERDEHQDAPPAGDVLEHLARGARLGHAVAALQQLAADAFEAARRQAA